MIAAVVRWWQDAGSVFVELATRGVFRCGRCGALQVRADTRKHYEWHLRHGD